MSGDIRGYKIDITGQGFLGNFTFQNCDFKSIEPMKLDLELTGCGIEF